MSPDQIQHLLKSLDAIDANMVAQIKVLKALTSEIALMSGEVEGIGRQVMAIDLQANPITAGLTPKQILSLPKEPF